MTANSKLGTHRQTGWQIGRQTAGERTPAGQVSGARAYNGSQDIRRVRERCERQNKINTNAESEQIGKRDEMKWITHTCRLPLAQRLSCSNLYGTALQQPLLPLP